MPIGIAVSRRDEVFVTEFRNNRVQKFDANGNLRGIYPVAEQPGGIAIDRQGRLSVTHLMPGTVTVYNTAGTLLHEWGGNGTGEGQFRQPGGLATAPNGTVYIADQVNRRVQQFSAEGTFLYGFGSQGSEPGQFMTPHGLAFDSRGCLYVCDTQNARIQKFAVVE